MQARDEVQMTAPPAQLDQILNTLEGMDCKEALHILIFALADVMAQSSDKFNKPMLDDVQLALADYYAQLYTSVMAPRTVQ